MLRPSRAVGFAAGLLALCLVVFFAAGLLWGVLRPELTGHRVESDGSTGYAIEGDESAQFVSFITFALATGLVGALFGIMTYLLAAPRRGLFALLWTGIACCAGALAFYYGGELTAARIPDNPGDTITFVPGFSPGIGLALAPLLATLGYWSAAFVGSDADWDPDWSRPGIPASAA